MAPGRRRGPRTRRERRWQRTRPGRPAISVLQTCFPPGGYLVGLTGTSWRSLAQYRRVTSGNPAGAANRHSPFAFLSSPHLVGELDDHAKLGPLFVLGQDIALLGRGEAALRGEAQLIDVDILRRLVDAPLDVVLLFQRTTLRGDEAEHDLLLALGHEAQRLETTGAIGVVFQEIAVDVDLAQQAIRDMVVTALGDKGGAEIAAAGMHGDHHVGGMAGERLVGHAGVLRGQAVRIVAALPGEFPLLRIADHRPGGVVELQVAAAGVVERSDGLLISQSAALEIAFDVGIELLVARLPALAEMQRRGRRDRHLRRHAGMALEEAEMLEVRMAGEIDLVHDAHAFGLGLDPGKGNALAGGVEFNAIEPLVEIELPPGAPELAVGRELEPDVLLLLDDLFDLAVLDLLELFGRALALLALRPRLLERRGAQQAADVIGAKWRFGSLHRSFPQRARYFHTSSASSLIMRSFAHCSSSARTLPSSVEAKPHCGERQNCSSGANLAASSIRRLPSSFFSSVPLLEVTSPSTTALLPFGRKRSGSKPPARSLSYSRK